MWFFGWRLVPHRHRTHLRSRKFAGGRPYTVREFPKEAAMIFLVVGLAIFLLTHSVRIVADDWRAAQIARLGEQSWKLRFSVLSAVGLALIVWGYGAARQAPVIVWHPPAGMRHVAGLLTLVAFVFLAAAYVPRNHLKARLHHPMVLGVKAWAAGHLFANAPWPACCCSAAS